MWDRMKASHLSRDRSGFCRPGSDRTWLSDRRGSHEADERDIRGAARLQGDGMDPEVLQHVEDGLEPEVLDPALAVLVQGQTEVLRDPRHGDM